MSPNYEVTFHHDYCYVFDMDRNFLIEKINYVGIFECYKLYAKPCLIM